MRNHTLHFEGTHRFSESLVRYAETGEALHFSDNLSSSSYRSRIAAGYEFIQATADYIM